MTGPHGLRLEEDSSLLARAARILADGPLTPQEVALRVMRLRGAPGASARAVGALLEGDERFQRASDGRWSLRAERPAGEALASERWAVVDVETTGGSPRRGHRVTEIAVVPVVGGVVGKPVCSLVNPERPIPPNISALTGITPAMVADAPRFGEIVPRLAHLLDGAVFVAHNAAFDWGFLSAEMSRCAGVVPQGRRLCTVRLARRLLPQLRSRRLPALARYYGIPLERHHRADGDAVATANLLLRLLDELAGRGVEDWQGLDVWLSRPRRRGRAGRAPRSVEAA